MKQLIQRSVAVIFLSIFLTVPAVAAQSGQESPDKTTKQEVKQELAQAADAIKDYSYEQREEAVKNVKKTLEDLDARIDELQTRIDDRWGEMEASARQQARAALKSLKEKRNEVAEWYGGLKHSSSEAWEEVKKGFASSYKTLSDAFDKAASEF